MQTVDILSLPVVPVPAVFGLNDRNAQAQKVIFDYAHGHALADIGVGLAGLFIPGGATVALMASVAAQAPLVYMPMSRKLADIYSAQMDPTSGRVVVAGAIAGGGLNIAASLGMDFLAEIATEILHENGLGIGVSAIPLIGSVIGAGLDAAIAATMTWRVGTMVSVYFQYGGGWVGSRRNTFELAKELAGGLSHKNENRVDLNSVPDHVPDVKKRMVAYAVDLVAAMTGAGLPQAAIRASLTKKGIPVWIIEQAFSILK
jgi:uncharacterized protein (DUF697 family)